jgi:hypothetical protein
VDSAPAATTGEAAGAEGEPAMEPAAEPAHSARERRETFMQHGGGRGAGLSNHSLNMARCVRC